MVNLLESVCVCACLGELIIHKQKVRCLNPNPQFFLIHTSMNCGCYALFLLLTPHIVIKIVVYFKRKECMKTPTIHASLNTKHLWVGVQVPHFLLVNIILSSCIKDFRYTATVLSLYLILSDCLNIHVSCHIQPRLLTFLVLCIQIFQLIIKSNKMKPSLSSCQLYISQDS